MAKLSLWKNEKLSNDFRYFDRIALETLQVGGVDLYIHKYAGAANANVASTEATLPNYTNQTAQNIGDLLFQETPNRVYEPDIYKLRGHYNASDIDLALTQFGLMINNGVLYITVHTKNMVDTIGRKIMAGDVIELPNMKDFYALDDTIPVALKRFYVVQDASRPANGYSPTWWNHLWRLKTIPMTDSQEFSDILDQPVTDATGNTIVIDGNVLTYGNIESSGDLYANINAAIVADAEYNVPESGYATEPLWQPLFVDGDPKKGTLPVGSSPQQKWTGYLVNGKHVMNGYPVTSGTSFPPNANDGDYFIRQDYFPARMYRKSGNVWQYVETENRTKLTNGTGKTQRDGFINNSNTFINSSGNTEPVLQNLSNLFRVDKGGNANT